jgi:hypothetical protein
MIALKTYLKVRMWELVENAHAKVEFNPDPFKDPFAEGGDSEVAEKMCQGNEAMRNKK